VSDVITLQAGQLPLLISVPHDGRRIPDEIRCRMTSVGTAIPDTDWYVAELYEFARDIGAWLLIANYSRYVVDLNRSANDDVLYPGQLVTGLCPLETFAGERIYNDSIVTDSEKSARIERYWRPYHDQLESLLQSIRAAYGYALLWDAHSIPSTVPRLFSGELPELNIGTNNGASCDEVLEEAVADVARDGPYSVAVNGRFRGGYITRHYGDPQKQVHALQLEIAQRTYMNEESGSLDPEKFPELRNHLRRMLRQFLESAQSRAKDRTSFSQG
jgi:N-formylglutamate amidohydrolase